MSAQDQTLFTPWISSPGLYSIHNVSTGLVLDQEDSDINKIHCCNGEPSLNISNPHQTWHLVITTDQSWLLINNRTGNYLAAPDADCSVFPQTGHPDWPAAQWKIVPVEVGGLYEVIFLSVANEGSCLELVEGRIAKIGKRNKDIAGQTWYLKRQSS